MDVAVPERDLLAPEWEPGRALIRPSRGRPKHGGAIGASSSLTPEGDRIAVRSTGDQPSVRRRMELPGFSGHEVREDDVLCPEGGQRDEPVTGLVEPSRRLGGCSSEHDAPRG